MADTAQPSARAALDELVHQFADPYAFMRELVQNAIDAGSSEIEVDVRFEPDGTDSGMIIIHVDDWGEGMTREVIEKKLTRLFSSSKDGDRTKIGKFGIGFVSVFSLGPDAVCIDTSRDGENWRVLFDADRTFELLTLPAPVDGTKIRVFKRGSTERFAEIRSRCAESLRFWCRHVEGDIRFAGTTIREEFVLLDTPCAVASNDSLTQIVVGHPRAMATFRGFYNKGLTLLETTSPGTSPGLETAGFAFKVSSGRLEHTLTRDAVIEDAEFRAVMREVVALIDGPLAHAVFERLEHEGAGPDVVYLVRAAMLHVARGVPESVGRYAIASSPSGAPIRIGDLRRGVKSNRVFYSVARAPVTDELERLGYTIVLGTPDDPRFALIKVFAPTVAAEAAVVGHHWCMPALVDPSLAPTAWTALREGVAGALDAIGAKVGSIVAADFDYPGSPIVDRIAVTQAKPGSLQQMDELEMLRPGLLSRRQALVVNVTHPSVRSFIALAATEPVVAAYLCVKAFRLGKGLDDAMDTQLVEHVVERRWPTPTH